MTVHGNAETYRRDKCRCAPCRYAASVARRNHQPLCDPAPIQAHLHALSAAGIGYRRVAELTGLAENTVYQILTLSRRPMTRTAERILAVTAEAGPAQRWLDATGSRRRLHALQALGWTVRELSALTGHNETMLVQIGGRKRLVAPATAAKIRDVYNRLSMQVPAESYGSKRARDRAMKRRYFPPLAWDDETIDDPAALPCLLPGAAPADRPVELAVQHLAAGHPVEVTVEVRDEFIRRTCTWPVAKVTTALGCSDDTVFRVRRGYR